MGKYLDQLRREFSGSPPLATAKGAKRGGLGASCSSCSTEGSAFSRIKTPQLPLETREAIAEAIEERAAIREFEAGEPRAVAEREARSAMRVYDLLVTMGPGEAPKWATLLAPGCNLEEARRVAESKFGAERLIEIREHPPWN